MLSCVTLCQKISNVDPTIHALRFDHSGKIFTSVLQNGDVMVCDIDAGTFHVINVDGEKFYYAEFNKTSNQILTISTSKVIRIWNYYRDKMIRLERQIEKRDSILLAKFSHSGKKLLILLDRCAEILNLKNNTARIFGGAKVFVYWIQSKSPTEDIIVSQIENNQANIRVMSMSARSINFTCAVKCSFVRFDRVNHRYLVCGNRTQINICEFDEYIPTEFYDQNIIKASSIRREIKLP